MQYDYNGTWIYNLLSVTNWLVLKRLTERPASPPFIIKAKMHWNFSLVEILYVNFTWIILGSAW